MAITDAVMEKTRELGCDIAGIAPVERFTNAPPEMSPGGLLPGAKSVVVMGIHHPDATVELGGEPTPHETGPYVTQMTMNSRLDDMSFLLARFLEDRGYASLPIAASNIWRYRQYKDLKVDFAPDLVHRYAAVAAGLGEIGWSGLFLNSEFGPRVRLVSVVTKAKMEPSPMYEGPALCDKCMECVENCPTDAFRKEVRKINKIEIGDRTFAFPDTNKWRCSWAENFGLNLALEIPEKIDEDTILENLEKHGFFKGEQGCCLRFCMVPSKRYYDNKYCRGPRRKKKPSVTAAKAWREIQKLCSENDVDICCIPSNSLFQNDTAVRPKLHLPDAASLVLLGMNVPPGTSGNNEVSRALARRLNYAAFDITRYLDVNGYSAVTQTKIRTELIAQKAGIYREGMVFRTVLSGAKLKPSVFSRRTGKNRKSCNVQELKAFCREAGADMAGIFSEGRFGRFSTGLQKAITVPAERKTVTDKGLRYGPCVPEINTEALSLKSPGTWLKGASSVIVMGLHFPHASMDTAKVTPAETTGPYAFAQYESLLLLKDAALQLTRRLNDCGYRATFTSDMTGLASVVQNPRGFIPDMRANLYPAMLAGLAYPGLHGCPITPEYGTRQRFIAVVTDCPLDSDPLYPGYACSECRKPCIAACPTSALKKKTGALKIEGTAFHLPIVDCFACDWAKRYGLAGKEGPQYYGMKTDMPVPEKKNAGEIVKALNRIEWGVQKRLMNMVEECIRTCPEKGSVKKQIKGHGERREANGGGTDTKGAK